MNIFVLDKNPAIAARYHCDKHVVKMILESAQMLSTCHSLCDGDPWYKPAHKNHPCTVWARKTKGNYKWLASLFRELCKVYTEVYGRQHKCSAIGGIDVPPAGLPDGPLTDFALAMPDEYKCDDPVASYRAYYAQEKRKLLDYKNREFPTWIDDYCGTCRDF